MTRRKEIIIVFINAFVTTAVVAIAKNLIGDIEASFLAGVGVGASQRAFVN